mgnify:CR=1 FL=1
MPVGNMGWMSAISTNLSYLGLRGNHPIRDDLAFIWQLGSRDRHIGNARHEGDELEHERRRQWRTVLAQQLRRIQREGLGQRDASASRRRRTSSRPIASIRSPGMIGDYRVIIGNTRRRQSRRIRYSRAHAIWYNSPNWSGFSFSAMYGPGQNRSNSSDPIGANSSLASAEQDCAGGNIPGKRRAARRPATTARSAACTA